MKFNIFLLVGLILIVGGLLYPMVTVVVDDSPPVIMSTTPPYGTPCKSLDKLVVYCKDLESGIKSVIVTIDGASYTLELSYRGSSYDIWHKPLDPPFSSPGEHTYKIVVTNNAGLKAEKSGTFSLYSTVKFDWYINGQKVTSKDATIYVTTRTVHFKCVKVEGPADSEIKAVYVVRAQDGSEVETLVTLEHTGSGVWEGDYTFTPGRHTLKLKVYYGTTYIELSIIDLQIGDSGNFFIDPFRLLILIAGGILVVYGLIKREE